VRRVEGRVVQAHREGTDYRVVSRAAAHRNGARRRRPPKFRPAAHPPANPSQRFVGRIVSTGATKTRHGDSSEESSARARRRPVTAIRRKNRQYGFGRRCPWSRTRDDSDVERMLAGNSPAAASSARSSLLVEVEEIALDPRRVGVLQRGAH
jgi:hypothetical protein